MSLFSLSILMPVAALADISGRHPAYLHGLSDLRTAYWLLDHRPGDPAVHHDEDVALSQVYDAVKEIQAASITDGKDMHDHPPVDAPPERLGRLHKALEFLNSAHADVAQEEDDPATQGLKHRALGHIDAATQATERAIAAAGGSKP